MELVERDLRLQEDKIYSLQNELMHHETLLAAAERENAKLRSQIGAGDGAAPATIPGPRRGSAGSRESPPPRDDDPPGLDIDPGTPFDPNGLKGPQFAPPGSSGALEDAGDTPVASSEAIRSLEFNKLLSGGLNGSVDGKDGGVLAVIEPRDAEGLLARPPGQVSLMVVDPATMQRIARWDFSGAETLAAWRRSLLGEGLHFLLAWPDDPPASKRLRMYARLELPDGQKLLSEFEFDADAAGLPITAIARRGETRSTQETGEAERLADRLSPAGAAPRWKSQPVGGAAIQKPKIPLVPLPSRAEPAQRGEHDGNGTETRPEDTPPSSETSPRQAGKPDRPSWSPFR